jgi:hypothetical protein
MAMLSAMEKRKDMSMGRKLAEASKKMLMIVFISPSGRCHTQKPPKLNDSP